MENGIKRTGEAGMIEKNSYDYIADMVRTYWKNTFPQDVVAFFWQKYSCEDKWEHHEEVIFCKSNSDYKTIEFLNDFCEGQTCVKDITIVPLSEVTKYYARMKLEETKIIKQKLTAVPAPSYPVAYCGCGLSFESPKYKEDCYFYGETNDMGAIIRFCTRDKIEWGYCPCEKCNQFLSKEEVDRVARNIFKTEQTK